MSLFGWFKSEAKPVEVNVSSHSQLIRNVNRLATLYLAQRQGDKREDVQKEIEVRREICKDFGHEVPYTLEAATVLQAKLNR